MIKEEVRDIVLFLALIFVLSWCSIAVYNFYVSPTTIEAITPKAYLINGIITQLGVFLGSFFLYLAITRQTFKTLVWFEKIQITWIYKTVLVLLATYIIVGILGYINGLLVEVFPNHSAILHSQKVSETQVRILSAFDGVQIIYPILVIAVLPAIAEELVFRGFLLKKLHDLTSNKQTAIIGSALIFAVVHFQVLNVLPIFFMGLVLGYIYVESRQIIYPMLLHFLFNAISVIGVQYASF